MTTPYEERQYAPIGVNIALSQHIDAIQYVNELNQYWLVLSPRMHYDYLFHSIRKMFRPRKPWAKKHEDDGTISMLQNYYQCNKVRAREYLKLLSPQQLKAIEVATEQGSH